MGPLSADAAPAVVGRLGLVLDTEFGFWASRRRRTTDDDETGLPPLNPPGSSNRKPQRNSDFDFRLFAVLIRKPFLSVTYMDMSTLLPSAIAEMAQKVGIVRYIAIAGSLFFLGL